MTWRNPGHGSRMAMGVEVWNRMLRVCVWVVMALTDAWWALRNAR